MNTHIRNAMIAILVASTGTVGTAIAADQWFVMGEKTIASTDPSTEIKSAGGRWDKDVKQVKLSAEGADVQVKKLVLHWDNRKDDTLEDVGTLKAGGETAPNNAPGRKGRLTSVTIHYEILGGKPTAELKVWGYD